MIDRETEFKLLGVVIQDNLKWNSHISSILKKTNKCIYHVGACKKAHLPDEVGLTTYTTKIRPLLEYACPIWGGIPDYLSLELQRVQDCCLKILGLPKDALETLASRRSITLPKMSWNWWWRATPLNTYLNNLTLAIILDAKDVIKCPYHVQWDTSNLLSQEH